MTTTDTESTVAAGSRLYQMPADQQGEALVAALALNGIERVWFTSGSEMTFLQEAVAKHRALGRPAPRIMTMTHENPALAAACGDALATGKPAAAAFHVECGLLNAGGQVHNADRGRYPLLIMSGYPPSAEAGSVSGARSSFIHYYQQIRDQGELFRQYTRWDHKLAPYDNAGTVVSRAVQVMLSEPMGPAYLAVPREASASPVAGGVARFPLVDQLRPAQLSAPDREALREVARWLLAAQAPLIAAGRVGRNPAVVAPLVELAELVGARVMSDAARLSFPSSHPLYRGLLAIAPTPPDTDCILALEALTPWLPGRFTPGPEVKLARIASDPAEHMTPLYEFPSDLSLVGDAAAAVPLLLEEVRSLMTAEQRRLAAERRARYEDEGRQRLARMLATAEADRAKGVIHPLWLSHQLGQVLDPETIVVQETAEVALLNRSVPGTMLGGGGSNLGFGAPAAVGIKAARPDQTVVATVGDGSWMFCNPQVTVWAAGFHRAPVLFVISNNRGYRTGTTDLVNAFPEGYAAQAKDFTGGLFDPCPNYSGEAAASGAYGEKVTDPNEVGPAIRRGLDAVQNGVPAVLDVWLPALG